MTPIGSLGIVPEKFSMYMIAFLVNMREEKLHNIREVKENCSHRIKKKSYTESGKYHILKADSRHARTPEDDYCASIVFLPGTVGRLEVFFGFFVGPLTTMKMPSANLCVCP